MQPLYLVNGQETSFMPMEETETELKNEQRQV